MAGQGRRGTKTGESCREARASRAGMARAGCEREREATGDGHTGATYRQEEVNLDHLTALGSRSKQGEKAATCASSAASP